MKRPSVAFPSACGAPLTSCIRKLLHRDAVLASLGVLPCFRVAAAVDDVSEGTARPIRHIDNRACALVTTVRDEASLSPGENGGHLR